jgi:hypothetical protein
MIFTLHRIPVLNFAQLPKAELKAQCSSGERRFVNADLSIFRTGRTFCEAKIGLRFPAPHLSLASTN